MHPPPQRHVECLVSVSHLWHNKNSDHRSLIWTASLNVLIRISQCESIYCGMYMCPARFTIHCKATLIGNVSHYVIKISLLDLPTSSLIPFLSFFFSLIYYFLPFLIFFYFFPLLSYSCIPFGRGACPGSHSVYLGWLFVPIVFMLHRGYEYHQSENWPVHV